jgi:hypothetical protein
MAETTDFEKLIGQEFDFYGVDNAAFKLGDRVWLAIEDEDDGYRSYLGSIEQRETKGFTFFATPLDCVRIDTDASIDDGFRLVSVADGHVWLEVGTDNVNDYYPYFVFRYEPRDKGGPG